MPFSLFFFFNDSATTEIYTLSLHDALPIFPAAAAVPLKSAVDVAQNGPIMENADSSARLRNAVCGTVEVAKDRKSTRLNSSHVEISYAVFCLKKKKNNTK